MPKTFKEYSKQSLERDKQAAKDRPQCHICEKPIIAEQEMDGEVQWVTVDGKKVPIHEDCRYEDMESTGRIPPHGGCGSID